MEETTLLRLENVDICREENVILHNASFVLKNGEFVYVIGKVGSGKSSLLKSLYCEIPIMNGDAFLMEYNLCKIKRKEIPYLRRKLGIVFQDFQLLTDRSVIKNLEFVLKATGWKNKEQIAERIDNVLIQVGMQNKGYKMPHELDPRGALLFPAGSLPQSRSGSGPMPPKCHPGCHTGPQTAHNGRLSLHGYAQEIPGHRSILQT